MLPPRVLIPLFLAPVPLFVVVVWATQNDRVPVVNAVIAAVSLGGAMLLLLDVAVWPRRGWKKALAGAGLLLASGLANAAWAWLQMRA